MEAKAYLYDLRISPRKVSIVLDLIRNKDVATAAGILANTRKAASEPVAKLLKSAVANAENNHSMDTPSSSFPSASLHPEESPRESRRVTKAELTVS